MIRAIVPAQDLPLIDRTAGDQREAGEILREWMTRGSSPRETGSLISSIRARLRILREERADEGEELFLATHDALQDEEVRILPRIADLLPDFRRRGSSMRRRLSFIVMSVIMRQARSSCCSRTRRQSSS